MSEREEREERKDDRRKDVRDELIEDELKALNEVMEDIEDLNGAAQMRVLRAAEALLPPVTTVTVPR